MADFDKPEDTRTLFRPFVIGLKFCNPLGPLENITVALKGATTF